MRRRVRDVAQIAFAKLEAAQRRYLEIRPGDPLARRFAAFGANSKIGYPWLEMIGPASIAVGQDVVIRSYASFEALSTPDKVVLRFGDRIHVGHGVRFVALNGIEIGDDIGIGHGSTLTDTVHEYKVAEDEQGLSQTPLKIGRPLRLEDGCWIGNNCVITGGITIGARSIVGPNSVINRDVPPGTIVLGNPPKIVRRKSDTGWEWTVDPASLELETPALEEPKG
jgi:acetyltransferase-like isoleucine patch superfamily enzyme